MVSSFILAVTEPRTGFLWSRDEVRGKLPLELLTSRPEKVQSAGWSSRERTGTKGQGQKLAGRVRNCQFPFARYTNLVSISANRGFDAYPQSCPLFKVRAMNGRRTN
jgi:hypothetical protein